MSGGSNYSNLKHVYGSDIYQVPRPATTSLPPPVYQRPMRAVELPLPSIPSSPPPPSLSSSSSSSTTPSPTSTTTPISCPPPHPKGQLHGPGATPPKTGYLSSGATPPKGSVSYLSGTPPKGTTYMKLAEDQPPVMIISNGYSKHHSRNHSRSSSISSVCTSVSSGSNSSSGEKMNLTTFASRHRDQLPLVVRVTKGYCGLDEESSISEGDTFNIHFVKHTTVMVVEYENRSGRFSVPMNSAVPFGVIYNPNNNQREALQGFQFPKVSDLLSMKTLPKIVCVKKAYNGSSAESTVAVNEILVINKVRKTLRGKQLKVYSITKGRDKTLSEACTGNFTTKPRDIKLFLTEILKYASEDLPQKAILFGNDDIPQHFPSKLSSTIVTLLHKTVEVSLVATSAIEYDMQNSPLMDIPLSLDITVRVVESVDADLRQLQESSAYLYSRFDMSRLNPYLHRCNSNGSLETQSLLYTTVRNEYSQGYVELSTPKMESLYDTLGHEGGEQTTPTPTQPPLPDNNSSNNSSTPASSGHYYFAKKSSSSSQEIPTSASGYDTATATNPRPSKCGSSGGVVVGNSSRGAVPSRSMSVPTNESDYSYVTTDFIRGHVLPPKAKTGEDKEGGSGDMNNSSGSDSVSALQQVHSWVSEMEQHILSSAASDSSSAAAATSAMSELKKKIENLSLSSSNANAADNKASSRDHSHSASGHAYSSSTCSYGSASGGNSGSSTSNSSPANSGSGSVVHSAAASDHLRRGGAAYATGGSSSSNNIKMTATTNACSMQQQPPLCETATLNRGGGGGGGGGGKEVSSSSVNNSTAVTTTRSVSDGTPHPQRDDRQDKPGGDVSKDATVAALSCGGGSRVEQPQSCAEPKGKRRSPAGSEEECDLTAQQKNIEYLNTLSTFEVLKLLEAMGLRQYQDKFSQEQISGKIMLELDSEVLEHDLGVASKLHRIRLTKVITGELSAEEILQNSSDSYVCMFPKQTAC